ncbi:MAG TPA: sigma-70 family RNA polymerase sigma factor [Acidimicrobiales bacterium]|nr:sigma-70 family RNA polymerase sigma factor [Acidimicrobiales bacterium]
MQAARGGDRAALDALLRRHYDRLYALCRRMTGDPADAADACQEALIAIVRGLPAFDGRSAFGTWAYRVATNACLDELRRRRRRPEPGLPEGSAEMASPVDAVESSTTRVDLDRALQTLPADYRAAVVLRDVCGLSYEEIGEALVIPPGTVRSRIARGRAALVPLLAPGRNPGPSAERPTTG